MEDGIEPSYFLDTSPPDPFDEKSPSIEVASIEEKKKAKKKKRERKRERGDRETLRYRVTPYSLNILLYHPPLALFKLTG